MAFVLPTFNLTCNIWHQVGGTYVNYALPDLTVVCNLAFGKRVAVPWSNAYDQGYMNLLLPALTDIRQLYNGAIGDLVECPAGSNRFYGVVGVDDIGKGFPNEHRMAWINYQTSGATFTVSGHIPAPVPLP